jgi:hypothetical protein
MWNAGAEPARVLEILSPGGLEDYFEELAPVLRDHARSRHPWELGDGDAVRAVVAFEGNAGPTTAAMTLGAPVDGAPTMRVRYSPRIARWIAEREGKPLAADGALVMEHPLADWDWGGRHVLQYGRDAEVVEPAALRARLTERLAGMAE